MALIVSPEVEQQINEWVGKPDYPDAQAVLSSAIRALAREREREDIESLLESSGIDDAEVARLMKEAEDSGPYSEMTRADWDEIEREGLALLEERRPPQ